MFLDRPCVRTHRIGCTEQRPNDVHRMREFAPNHIDIIRFVHQKNQFISLNICLFPVFFSQTYSIDEKTPKYKFYYVALVDIEIINFTHLPFGHVYVGNRLTNHL